MSSNHARIFSGSLFVFGVVGLLVTLLGEITTLGKYRSMPPRSWEQYDEKLVLETSDIDLLEKKLDSLISQSMTEKEKTSIIYELVINRFSHGDQAKYNIFSNWVLWLMSKVSPEFAYIRQPSVLVEKGYSALCSEQSYLLQTLAEAQGIRSRQVGLHGHVVMEAWYDSDWHLYDPDLEVVPVLANQRVLSLDELSRSPELIRKFYAGRGSRQYIESIVNIIGTREDNSFVSYPRLALFEWKTNVLFHFERIASVMKWAIPVIILLMGLGIEFRNRKH
jgi:hypothetical protein